MRGRGGAWRACQPSTAGLRGTRTRGCGDPRRQRGGGLRWRIARCQ